MGMNESKPNENQLIETAVKKKDYDQFVKLYQKAVSGGMENILKRKELLFLVIQREEVKARLIEAGLTPRLLNQQAEEVIKQNLHNCLSRDAPRIASDGVDQAAWINLCTAAQLYYLRQGVFTQATCGCSGLGFVVNFLLLLDPESS